MSQLRQLPPNQPAPPIPHLPEGSRTGSSGLILPDALTLDEWASIAPRFRLIYSMTQWHLGDWLLYGERRWGRMYSRCQEVTGRRYQTLANAVRVARAFPLHTRRAELSWSHHEAVTRLPEYERERWLTLAEVNRWSVQALRSEVAAGSAATSGLRARDETAANSRRLQLPRQTARLIDACREKIAEEGTIVSRAQMIETAVNEWARSTGMMG